MRMSHASHAVLSVLRLCVLLPYQEKVKPETYNDVAQNETSNRTSLSLLPPKQLYHPQLKQLPSPSSRRLRGSLPRSHRVLL
ncbi:hypothetical protein CPB84DRAFT_1792310, partial [Gymnopilus junonius]